MPNNGLSLDPKGAMLSPEIVIQHDVTYECLGKYLLLPFYHKKKKRQRKQVLARLCGARPAQKAKSTDCFAIMQTTTFLLTIIDNSVPILPIM